MNRKHLYISNQRHSSFEASGLTRSLSWLLNGLCLHSCQWSVREKICLIFEKFPFLEKPDSWDTLGQPPLSSGWTVGIHYAVCCILCFQQSFKDLSTADIKTLIQSLSNRTMVLKSIYQRTQCVAFRDRWKECFCNKSFASELVGSWEASNADFRRIFMESK